MREVGSGVRFHLCRRLSSDLHPWFDSVALEGLRIRRRSSCWTSRTSLHATTSSRYVGVGVGWSGRCS
jgi:hypothetical protein